MTLASIDRDHILDHTRELWKGLMGGRIFITGGTGFFGSWLLDSFVYANQRLGLDAEAVVLTRSVQRPPLDRVTFYAGDVRTFEFPQGEFTHIIHGATAAHQRSSNEASRLMVETILDGTRRTLEFAEKSGAKRFLFVSSGAVYGPQSPELGLIPEHLLGAPDPLKPHSAYGLAKRMAEHLCILHAQEHNYAAVMARGFAFIGPHLPLDAHYAVGDFIRDGLAGHPIQVKSDGSGVRSYLYAADLAIWLWTLLIRGAAGQAYNVGSMDPISIGDLARTIGQLTGVGVQFTKSPGSGAPDSRYVPSTHRAEQELGLRTWITLPDALERTIEWHRQRNPKPLL